MVSIVWHRLTIPVTIDITASSRHAHDILIFCTTYPFKLLHRLKYTERWHGYARTELHVSSTSVLRPVCRVYLHTGVSHSIMPGDMAELTR